MAKMCFTNGHEKKVTREVNETISLRDYLGTACYPLLVLFANPQLSVSDIGRWLRLTARTTPGTERPDGWIQKRRWMTEKPGAAPGGPRPNGDGKDARAVAIMRDNPKLSARKLLALLNERGIARNKDWILKHRCD